MLCEGYNPSNGTYHNVTCLVHLSWRPTCCVKVITPVMVRIIMLHVSNIVVETNMLCEGYNPSNGTYHNVTCLEHCRGYQHVV